MRPPAPGAAPPCLDPRRPPPGRARAVSDGGEVFQPCENASAPPLAMGRSGVYVLILRARGQNGKPCVYVGQSTDMDRRVRLHMGGEPLPPTWNHVRFIIEKGGIFAPYNTRGSNLEREILAAARRRRRTPCPPPCPSPCLPPCPPQHAGSSRTRRSTSSSRPSSRKTESHYESYGEFPACAGRAGRRPVVLWLNVNPPISGIVGNQNSGSSRDTAVTESRSCTLT